MATSKERINANGCDCPKMRDLVTHVVPSVALKWYDLGLQLLDQKYVYELDIIEYEESDTKTRCRKMFNKWLKTDETPSWDKVTESLTEIGLSNVAINIEQLLLSANHSSCTDDLVDESRATEEGRKKIKPSERGTEERMKSVCTESGDGWLPQASKIIKGRYKRKRLTAEKDSWPPFHAKSFINLALVHQKIAQLQTQEDTTQATIVRFKGEIDRIPVVTSSIKLDDIQQIFAPISSEREPRSILIEGHPGIGKTTLAKEICLQWANNKLLTSDKLLLLLMLRDPNVQECTTTEELVKYILPEIPVESVSNHLEKEVGAEMTFIIDGFDELSNKLRDVSVFRRLIEGDSLPYAKVVVTSRPSASACLHQYVDRRIEVLGFEKCSREQYINDALKDSPKLQMLKKHFQLYPNIDAMCYIPLNMAIIVFLCLLGSLPPTATEMFANFILHTVCHYLKRKRNILVDEHINKMEHLPQPIQKALQQLWKVAYFGLISDKIVFTIDDLPKVCRDDPTCYGLLQSVECYNSQEIGPTKSFNFLHLGIQEYFAAKYVTTLPEYKVNALLEETFLVTKIQSHFYWHESVNSQSARLSNMWIMYFGITNGRCNSLRQYLGMPKYVPPPFPRFAPAHHLPSTLPVESHYCDIRPSFTNSPSQVTSAKVTASYQQESFSGQEICNTVSISQGILKDSLKVLYLFQCFQEAQDDRLCDILSKSFDSGEIKLREHRLLPHQVVSLGFFLSRSHKDWKELDLYKCHIGDYGINLLHQYLCGDKTNKQRIMTIDVCVNDLTLASSPLVADIITQYQPHTLKLSNATVDIKKIPTAVVNTNTVKVLHLHGSPGAVKSAISDMIPSLKELNISSNRFSNDDVEILSKSDILHVLEISSCNLIATGLMTLTAILTQNTSLTILRLTDNLLGQDGATKIAQTIALSKTLKELNINNNSIAACGADAIAHNLMCNDSLVVLHLSSNAIGPRGAKSIGQVIISTKVLKELNINNNIITANGAAAIAHGLMHNTSLEVLLMNTNAIGHNGATAIAKATTANKTLKELDISNNRIADTVLGTIAIAKIIKNNMTVKKLNIAKNNISVKQVGIITQCLAVNTSLEVFQISDNIGMYGVSEIANAIAVNKTLKELSLSFVNVLHEDSAITIMNSLYYNNSITKLEIPEKLLNFDSVHFWVKTINSTRKECNIPELVILPLQTVMADSSHHITTI